jgi:ferritin
MGGNSKRDKTRTDFQDDIPPGLTTHEVHHAANQAHPNPTEAQKEAGNYRKGHMVLWGFPISVENARGALRSGKDKTGRPWSIRMRHHYGYVRKTQGYDGDPLDVIIGPDMTSQKAFIIDQVDPSTGKFDEHKIVLGAKNETDAREIYQTMHEPGWCGLGAIHETTIEGLHAWAHDPVNTRKPASQTLPQENSSDDAAGSVVVRQLLSKATMATDMNPILVTMIQDQAARECTAMCTYLSLSLWCKNQGFKWAGKRLKEWSKDEAHDRDKWLNFLNDYAGILPEVPGCVPMRLMPMSLLDCFDQLLALELTVTENIQILARQADELGEEVVEAFAGDFLKDQIEQVKRIRYVVKVLQFAGDNTSAILHLEHRLPE